MKPIAKRIKEAREAKGWSGTDLAKHAGIRQSFIGALESGAQETSGYLPEIAHALGVDAYWLKTGTERQSGGARRSFIAARPFARRVGGLEIGRLNAQEVEECRVHAAISGLPLLERAAAGVQCLGAPVLRCGDAAAKPRLHSLACGADISGRRRGFTH